jgi:hypothetical protein
MTRRLSLPAAASLVGALWVPYTVLNTLYPGPIVTYSLGLACAGLALSTLRLAGMTREELFVGLGPLSRRGAAVLAALSLFIPLALLAGRGQPWNVLDDLVYAPASGVAQELYFRSALLPVLLTLCPARPARGIALQALLFALWHARAYRAVPAGPATGVLAVAFVGGLLWGWQVWHDRTVVYAAVQHTLFLIIQ